MSNDLEAAAKELELKNMGLQGVAASRSDVIDDLIAEEAKLVDLAGRQKTEIEKLEGELKQESLTTAYVRDVVNKNEKLASDVKALRDALDFYAGDEDSGQLAAKALTQTGGSDGGE